MARGFFGSKFGDTQPATDTTPSIKGRYTLDDNYYSKREGGWVQPFPIGASGGIISEYALSLIHI